MPKRNTGTRFPRREAIRKPRPAVGVAPAGQPAAIIDAWLDGKFTLLTCAEPDTVVADAQTILGRVDALEPFHVARAGICEAFDRSA